MTQEEQIAKGKAIKQELDVILQDDKYPERERNLVTLLNRSIEALNVFNQAWNGMAAYMPSFKNETTEEWVSILALFQATTERTQRVIVPFLRTECPVLWPELNRVLFNGKFTEMPKVEAPNG